MKDKLKIIGKILLVIVYVVGFLVLLGFCAYQIIFNTEEHLRVIALILWSMCIGAICFVAGMIVVIRIRRTKNG